MKSKFLKTNQTYDGSQLRPQFAYLGHRLLGDSIVAWVGPCDVSLDHMVDGEDLLQKAEIAGSKMVHFVIEYFDQNLLSGVALQRLFANIVRDVVVELSPVKNLRILRKGDDLYWNQSKLSISIATVSPISTMIHFAVNISTKGVPVKACGLEDLKVPHETFTKLCLKRFSEEFDNIKEATWKVRPIS